MFEFKKRKIKTKKLIKITRCIRSILPSVQWAEQVWSWGNMYLPKHEKWPSQHLYLKIYSGFHAKESQATISESSHVQWFFIQQKAHLCFTPWTDHPVHEKVLILSQTTRPVCFRGHWHIKSSHSFRRIDASGWIGLAISY